MFTGIIEEQGRVVACDIGAGSARLTVHGPLVTSDAELGCSIAVGGVCLTVTSLDGEDFSVDVMAETLQRSALADLVPGSTVNLERAMSASGRFGGHIVQGHVDAVGSVVARTPGERWDLIEVAMPQHIARYVVEKGSITVDGISLTVASRMAGEDGARFTVSLIPTTLAHTTAGQWGIGDRVNLEVDVLAKYVEQMLAGRVEQMLAGRVEQPR